MKPVILGVLGAFFFSFTYVFNRSIALDGGSWIWSSSLRYLFLLPLLLPIVMIRGNLRPVFASIQQRPYAWFCWSTVGFVVFYIPLTIAAAYAPAWLLAVSWEITLIAGICMTPLFYHEVKTKNGVIRVRQKFPFKSLGLSSLIILGVVVIQMENAADIGTEELIKTVVLVAVGATAYPLGNRKMMEVCGGELDAFQRVLGMTLVTLPWWLFLGAYGLYEVGLPSPGQTVQAFMVAFFVSLIATVLFFAATDLVKNDMTKLAGVEATQACEIIFAIVIEFLFLGGAWPSPVSWLGIGLILTGMIVYSKWINEVIE